MKQWCLEPGFVVYPAQSCITRSSFTVCLSLPLVLQGLCAKEPWLGLSMLACLDAGSGLEAAQGAPARLASMLHFHAHDAPCLSWTCIDCWP